MNGKIKETIDKYNIFENCTEDIISSLLVKIDNDKHIHDLSAKIDIRNYISKNITKFPKVGRNTKNYWIARGWDKFIAINKVKEITKSIKKKPSPFSIDFWLEKGYTKEEAEYKRNSIRPIRKEYWLEKGYSEDESIKRAKETKDNNNKKGMQKASKLTKDERKYFSPRCKEYWISKGYSEDEALDKISEVQSTFSKEKCIEKYGDIEGLKVWSERQEKWQNTLNSKSKEELEYINKKKMHSLKWMSEYFSISLDEVIDKIDNIDKDMLKKYEGIIRRLTYKYYFDNIDIIDPNRLRGNGYDIDHKFSILMGYLCNIKEDIMASKYNLQLVTSTYNQNKNARCDITKEELENLYYKEKNE